MPTSLTATAAMILIVRGRMTNQARLDHPMTETEAWTLLSDALSLDYRRLAAHRLIDLAVDAKDSPALDRVITALEFSEVLCDGLLHRIANQHVCRAWRKWAKRRLRAPALALAA